MSDNQLLAQNMPAQSIQTATGGSQLDRYKQKYFN